MTSVNFGAGVREVVGALKAAGYETFTKGWPDILAFHPTHHHALAVEVKWGIDRPSRSQTAVQEILWRVGLPTFEVRDHLTNEAAQRTLGHRLREHGKTPIVLRDAFFEALREPLACSPVADRLLLTGASPVWTAICGQCHAPIILGDEPIEIPRELRPNEGVQKRGATQ